MVDKLGPLLTNALATLQRPGGGQVSGDRSTVGARTRGERYESKASTLEQRVQQRLLALDPDDPFRRRKAFRVYLEARLTQEFGVALGNEAGFQALVDDVMQAMELDVGVKADIDEAVDRLLAEAPRR